MAKAHFLVGVSVDLSRVGDALRRNATAIRAIQWVIVVFYAVLVVVPAFLPQPPAESTLLGNLTLFAQFVFWGVWWPFVMVSTMLVGRAWCGIFCPEGTLTEFASRHGLGRSIPRWIRWGGWPMTAFLMTTVYGQLVSVYEYPQAALLVLGGSTVAAVVIGAIFGKGKRVWCRHLCPANGVFALLARVAPVRFRTDAEAWRSHRGRAPAIDCGPLVDLRHLSSASQCHACGRCSGYRGAIALSARSPNAEILSARGGAGASAEALLLLFGLVGVATGAFHWTLSSWFVAMKTAAGERLLDLGWTFLLADNAPWWLLTHAPEAGDVFTWLDGICVVAYIGAMALVLGGVAFIGVFAAARIAGGIDWRALSLALIPVAGICLFLGLSMMTLTQLRAEGLRPGWIGEARAALLALGIGWSCWLGSRVIAGRARRGWRAALAMVPFSLPLAAVGGVWYLAFYSWQ